MTLVLDIAKFSKTQLEAAFAEVLGLRDNWKVTEKGSGRPGENVGETDRQRQSPTDEQTDRAREIQRNMHRMRRKEAGKMSADMHRTK